MLHSDSDAPRASGDAVPQGRCEEDLDPWRRPHEQQLRSRWTEPVHAPQVPTLDRRRWPRRRRRLRARSLRRRLELDEQRNVGGRRPPRPAETAAAAAETAATSAAETAASAATSARRRPPGVQGTASRLRPRRRPDARHQGGVGSRASRHHARVHGQGHARRPRRSRATQPDTQDILSGYFHQMDLLWPTGNLMVLDVANVANWAGVSALHKTGALKERQPARSGRRAVPQDLPRRTTVRRSPRARPPS